MSVYGEYYAIKAKCVTNVKGRVAINNHTCNCIACETTDLGLRVKASAVDKPKVDDPRGGDLYQARMKPGEIPVEVRTSSNVQFDW